jgi:peptidoglycan-associated lipoprotein
MKKVNLRKFAWGFVFLVLLSAACKKKTPVAPPPPPPPPAAKPAPTVTISAAPGTIQRGDSTTLQWSSQNATDLSIEPGVGKVDASGTKSVSPSDSTTYTITARGDGGSVTATTRVTVTAPPPPPPTPKAEAPAPSVSTQEKFERAIKDAYFDFDKADIRDDSRANLTSSADFLRANSNLTISIEGHCDERGSVAYNLGLGDRRAIAAKEFLVSLGISADRIKTISYGKERPFCTEKDETCWQQNRRGHLVCENCGN